MPQMSDESLFQNEIRHNNVAINAPAGADVGRIFSQYKGQDLLAFVQRNAWNKEAEKRKCTARHRKVPTSQMSNKEPNWLRSYQQTASSLESIYRWVWVWGAFVLTCPCLRRNWSSTSSTTILHQDFSAVWGITDSDGNNQKSSLLVFQQAETEANLSAASRSFPRSQVIYVKPHGNSSADIFPYLRLLSSSFVFMRHISFGYFSYLCCFDFHVTCHSAAMVA